MAEIRQIQVDGVNYDLVVSEDEVSATAAAQSAAQALAYKNQAQTSAAQAQTQATNASNQADRAQDAADRAEAIVGGQFVSYGEDQGLTDAYKEQARKNIGAGGSNDNLLDNAYFVGGGSQLGDGIFPINQRGQTSYRNSAVGWFDRWMNGYSQATATLTANGVKLSAAKWLFQPLRKEVYEGLEGKTVTASVMLADGTIYSGTNTFTANSDVHFVWVVVGGENLELRTSKYGTAPSFQLVNFTPDAGSEMTIAAFKLEKGTVSTLANDAPPNFGEELRKCQRYLFIRDYAKNDIIANGLTNNLTMFLPASMRSGGSPIMTFTVTPYVIGNGVISTPTSVNLVSVNGNQVQIYAPTTESHNAQAIVLYAVSATRMTIANEL